MNKRSKNSEGERQRRASQRAMSVRDFCKIYGIGRTSLYAEIAAGRLKVRKVGRRTLIGDDDAEEWWHSLPEPRGKLDEVPLSVLCPAPQGPGEGTRARNSSVPMHKAAITGSGEERPPKNRTSTRSGNDKAGDPASMEDA
jgi:excisionase family DNA binding protein